MKYFTSLNMIHMVKIMILSPFSLRMCQPVSVIGYYKDSLTFAQAHYGDSLTLSQTYYGDSLMFSQLLLV